MTIRDGDGRVSVIRERDADDWMVIAFWIIDFLLLVLGTIAFNDSLPWWGYPVGLGLVLFLVLLVVLVVWGKPR